MRVAGRAGRAGWSVRLPVGLLVWLAGEAAGRAGRCGWPVWLAGLAAGTKPAGQAGGLAFGLAFGKVWRSGGRKVWLTKPAGKVGGKDDPSDPAGESFR